MSATPKKQKTWRTFLPLDGIRFGGGLPEVVFGNFKLSRLKNEGVPQLISDAANKQTSFHNLCLSHSVKGTEAGEPFCEECPRKNANPNRTQCICVGIKERPGQLINPVSLSLDILRDVTALLRFYLYVSCKGSLPVMNLIDSRNLPTYGSIPSISSDGEVEVVSFEPGLRGYTMRINAEKVLAWQKLDFAKVIAVVESRHLGIAVPDFDENIVSALIWCGEMLAELEIKECFLHGATALETISSKVAGLGEISKQFRQLGAGLAAIHVFPELLEPTTQPNASSRKMFDEAKTLFKKAYGLRCHISHGSSGVGNNHDEEMWRSQGIFVSACVGAILLWQREPTKDGFYKSLGEIVAKLHGTKSKK